MNRPGRRNLCFRASPADSTKKAKEPMNAKNQTSLCVQRSASTEQTIPTNDTDARMSALTMFLHVAVLTLLGCELRRQLYAVSASYCEHGALRESSVHFAGCIANMPILYVRKRATVHAVEQTGVGHWRSDQSHAKLSRAENLNYFSPQVLHLIRATDEAQLHQCAIAGLRKSFQELRQGRARLAHRLQKDWIVGLRL